MNTQLQQLIEEMKADVSMAKWKHSMLNNFDSDSSLQLEAEIIAIEKYIPKLTKILNEGSVAASSSTDNEFAKGWANRPC